MAPPLATRPGSPTTTAATCCGSCGSGARHDHCSRGWRDAGVATIANWEELRQAGRSSKESVLARLPELLGELAERVEAHGGHVCWASTAEEATSYVLGVARRRGVRVVVKSKSMASEEI